MKDDIFSTGWPNNPTLADQLVADCAIGNKYWKSLDNARKKRKDWLDPTTAPILVRKTRKY